ncbi:hypothetical protein HTZ84_22305 [Haloterrigena sp. SYSU A558-1]|uniref:DUF8115 domain-containing protein n=1 Tax=Haloterrigena gelatinilytica TaxID=2741724 RepID=A0ABX2LK96_9EURY|nr:hypothetical protein [Haloterrigena gelatinilytica]NUC75000.1 hypothetical protein [Haloterrigena gelatinilytica]
MTDDTETDPQELIDQHKNETDGGHSQTEAAVEKNDDADETPELEDAVADAYEKIDEGDRSSNLTLRDENLAALFHGLEDANQLADVGDAAAEELGWDQDDTDTRAGVLRALVRIGLKEVDEDVIQAGKDGRDQFHTSGEF